MYYVFVHGANIGNLIPGFGKQRDLRSNGFIDFVPQEQGEFNTYHTIQYSNIGAPTGIADGKSDRDLWLQTPNLRVREKTKA